MGSRVLAAAGEEAFLPGGAGSALRENLGAAAAAFGQLVLAHGRSLPARGADESSDQAYAASVSAATAAARANAICASADVARSVSSVAAASSPSSSTSGAR